MGGLGKVWVALFYMRVVLLPLSLVIHISGDMASSLLLRMWGRFLDGIAVLVFC